MFVRNVKELKYERVAVVLATTNSVFSPTMFVSKMLAKLVFFVWFSPLKFKISFLNLKIKRMIWFMSCFIVKFLAIKSIVSFLHKIKKKYQTWNSKMFRLFF